MKRITLITFLAATLVSGCAGGIDYETKASEVSESPEVATSDFWLLDVTVLSFMELMPVFNAYTYIAAADGSIFQSRTDYDGLAVMSVSKEMEGWHLVMFAPGYKETHYFPASLSLEDLDDTTVSMVGESTWEALYDSANVTADGSSGLVLVRALDATGAPLTSGTLRLYTDTEEIVIGEDAKSGLEPRLGLDEYAIYNVPAGPNAVTVRSGFQTGTTYFEVTAGAVSMVDVRIP